MHLLCSNTIVDGSNWQVNVYTAQMKSVSVKQVGNSMAVLGTAEFGSICCWKLHLN